jgi:hypothetical protein
VFDFGSSAAGEGEASSAETSILVTASTCDTAHFGSVRNNALSFMFHVYDSHFFAQHEESLPIDEPAHVVLTVAPAYGLVLYLDGEAVADAGALVDLGDIVDENVWIGRSQWSADANLAARVHDFRIYGNTLSPSQVLELYEEGFE